METKRYLALFVMASLLLSGCQAVNKGGSSEADSSSAASTTSVTSSASTSTGETSSNTGETSSNTGETSFNNNETVSSSTSNESGQAMGTESTGELSGTPSAYEEIVDLCKNAGASPFSIVDATEPVDPSSLWHAGSFTVVTNGVGSFSVVNNLLLTVNLYIYGDEGTLSAFYAALDTDMIFFIPECVESDGSYYASSVKLYDRDGNPLSGLNTEEAVKSWKEQFASDKLGDLASAEVITAETINISELKPDTLYKSEGTKTKIFNDTGKPCVLSVTEEDIFSDWETHSVGIPAIMVPDSYCCYEKTERWGVPEDNPDSEELIPLAYDLYFMIDSTGNFEAAMNDMLMWDSGIKTVTVSELKSGEEKSTFKDFIYNDTGSDATLSYVAGSEEGTMTIKAGEWVGMDWTSCDVTCS